jgi:hypothetical protein
MDTDGAGVTLLDEHGDRVTAAVTDPLVSHVDGLQYSSTRAPASPRGSGGPWCASTTSPARTGGRAGPPAFEPCSVRRWWPTTRRWGALKVYSRRPGAYGYHDERLLTMFAAHAAVLLANVRSYEDVKRVSDELRDSMRVRDLVNTAKGVLMARDATDERMAFLLLTGMARDQGRPLREIADGLAGTTVRRRR